MIINQDRTGLQEKNEILKRFLIFRTKSVIFSASQNGIGKLVKIQHGPATVTGDESRNVSHWLYAGKAVTSRTIRKSGYLNVYSMYKYAF